MKITQLPRSRSYSAFTVIILTLGLVGLLALPAQAKDTTPDDLVISEIMASWPTESSKGLIITKVHHEEDAQWMEVYNPSSEGLGGKVVQKLLGDTRRATLFTALSGRDRSVSLASF